MLAPSPTPPLAATTAAAAALTTLINGALWWLGSALGPAWGGGGMTIGVGEVVLFSLLGVGAGLGLRAAVLRLSHRPRRRFAQVCIGVLVVYALGPLSAMYAPYMEGAVRFTLSTVLATEAMHLVSGLGLLYAFGPKLPTVA